MRFGFHAGATFIILTAIAAPGYAAVLGFHVTSDAVSAPGFVIHTITVDTDADLTAVGAVSNITLGGLNQLAVPPFFPNSETASPVFDLSDGGLFDSYVQINGDSSTAATIGGGGAIGGGALPIFNSNGIDLTWDNVRDTDIGNGLFIAQFVLSTNANGTFRLQAITAGDDHATFIPALYFVNGYYIPEPGTAVLLGAFGAFIVSRRLTR